MKAAGNGDIEDLKKLLVGGARVNAVDKVWFLEACLIIDASISMGEPLSIWLLGMVTLKLLLYF